MFRVRRKTLYGRESLIVMAEHFKSISNTVVGTVQYWITVIWLFTFKIVFLINLNLYWPIFGHGKMARKIEKFLMSFPGFANKG